MKNKKILLQNVLVFVPFFQLYIVNFFQIRIAETIKLFIFAGIYLLLFNISRIAFNRYFRIKNTEYFLVIIFYLSFNYSNITIFVYFEAFDPIKYIPNYSFFSFLILTVLLLLVSTRSFFDKLFEYLILFYVVFVVLISFNSIGFDLQEKNIDTQVKNDYININLESKPDLYFIIYDGLPSLETMEQFYDYDSIKFEKLFNENNLTNYGLATSSFGRTKYTMSSLFNMEYIFVEGDIPFSDRAILSNKYRTGDTVFENILRNNNYSIYKFGMAFNCNKNKKDICLNENIKNYTEKNSVYYDLIMRTPLKILIEKGLVTLSPSLSIGCQNGCNDPELDEIFINIDNKNKPKAVFLHFMDTHGPYLLGKNCKLLDEPIFDLPKTNIKSYKESLDCALKKINDLITILDLENDIVFIQSDHGPNYEKMELTDIEDLTTEQVLNRYSTFSISNLDTFCDKSNNNLNNTVNTFVYFTNCFAISEIPLLEAKNFLAFGKINSFVFDITDVVQEALLSNYK